jgi:uncharacterized membrane protein
MEKINWKQKLSSRKFWAMIIGFVGSLLAMFLSNDIVLQITGLLGQVAAIVVYMLSEAMIDAARVKKDDEK